MIKLREGMDYRIAAPSDENSLANIEILQGPFANVIFRYGKISVNENKEDDSATLSFEYDVIDNNGILDIEDNEHFKNYMGDLITQFLEDQMSKYEVKEPFIDDVDENDIVEE